MFIVKGNLNGLMKQEQLILFDHIHLYTLVLYSNYIEKKRNIIFDKISSKFSSNYISLHQSENIST